MTLWTDRRKGDLREDPAQLQLISFPNSTGAAKAIGLVIPELNGKLRICSACSDPDRILLQFLTAVVDGTVTVDQVNAIMKEQRLQSPSDTIQMRSYPATSSV